MAFRENNAVIEEMGSIIRVEFESFLVEKEDREDFSDRSTRSGMTTLGDMDSIDGVDLAFHLDARGGCASHVDMGGQEHLVVEGLAEKIVASGGRQRMPIREYYPGEKPYRMVYMEDPWGNIIELYSHSYELTYSAGAYQG